MNDNPNTGWFEFTAHYVVRRFNTMYRHTQTFYPTVILSGIDSKLVLYTTRLDEGSTDQLIDDIDAMCIPAYTAGRYVGAIVLAFAGLIAEVPDEFSEIGLSDPEAGAERLVLVGMSRQGDLCSRGYPINTTTRAYEVDESDGFPISRVVIDDMATELELVWKSAKELEASDGHDVWPLSLETAGLAVIDEFPQIAMEYHLMPPEMKMEMVTRMREARDER